MHADIELLIVGLTSGALYALLGSGLIIVYRTSKIINFAQGAIATIGTFVYLRCLEEWNLPLALAIVIGIATSTVIGCLFQLLALRPLRNASPLARTAATLGLLLGLTACVTPIFGNFPPLTQPIFSQRLITLPFGTPPFVIGVNYIWITAISVGLIAILFAVYRYTSFGRVTRGASDNEFAMSLMGYAPQRIELLNWGLAAALGGIAGILLSSISEPDASSYTLVLIVSIAAALIAGFRSFGILLGVCVLLGGFQSILVRYEAQIQTSTHLVGLDQALPVLVIIIGVVIAGRTIAPKGSFDERRLPVTSIAKHPVRMATIAFAIGAVWILLVSPQMDSFTVVSLVGILMALSLVVLTGFVGQISLVQMSLAGFGAFVCARLAESTGIPFPITILIGGLCAVPLGLLVGLPSLRVRGLNLAIVTLGFAVIMDFVFFSAPLTGSTDGLIVPAARLGPIDLNAVTHTRSYAIAALVITVLAGLAVAKLRSSLLGRRLVACRSNERGASAVGISVPKAKLIAFSISAFIAGVAGSLIAYSSSRVTWEGFGFLASISLVAFAYIGGITTIAGAVVTGIVITNGILAYYLPFQGGAASVLQIISGFGLIMVVVLHPSGIAGIPEQLVEMARGRKRGHSGLVPVEQSALPSSEPDKSMVSVDVESLSGHDEVEADVGAAGT
jgi:ABC-type branched-subunit amino acid transport system permease subunit